MIGAQVLRTGHVPEERVELAHHLVERGKFPASGPLEAARESRPSIVLAGLGGRGRVGDHVHKATTTGEMPVELLVDWHGPKCG